MLIQLIIYNSFKEKGLHILLIALRHSLTSLMIYFNIAELILMTRQIKPLSQQSKNLYILLKSLPLQLISLRTSSLPHPHCQAFIHLRHHCKHRFKARKKSWFTASKANLEPQLLSAVISCGSLDLLLSKL